MIFFRDNAPPIEDYDKTLNELIDLGWIQKIYNIEMNKSIYDMTSLGYQYYFAICMKVGYTQMFGGPTLTEGQTTAYINEDIDLVEEGYIIDGIDSAKLTPIAAEYLYVLTDAHGKEVKVKKQKNNQQKNSSTASKIGVGMMKFMKGIQQASKVAQEYDKNSTVATRNAWVEDKKGACPNCNYINSPKSKFCIKCGNSLKGKDKGSSRKRASRKKRRSKN